MSECPYCSRLSRLHGRHGSYCQVCALWKYRNATCKTLNLLACRPVHSVCVEVLHTGSVRRQILDYTDGDYSFHYNRASVKCWLWFLRGRFDIRWNNSDDESFDDDDDEGWPHNLYEGVWPVSVLTQSGTQPLPYFRQLYGLKLNASASPKDCCELLLDNRLLSQ